MQYKIVSSWKASDLADGVNEFLEKGWRLRGHLIVKHDPKEKNRLCYMQALVKEEK